MLGMTEAQRLHPSQRMPIMRPSLVLGLLAVMAACSPEQNKSVAADTAFASMQQRGATVMGVDQYTSAHIFEDLPDGGRILLDRDDSTDATGIAAIRTHMRDIAESFRAGDFSRPFEVHAQNVPGTEVMTRRRAAITYAASDRPRGGEVRIQSSDTTAVHAIHEFLAFQRDAHHAAGEGGGHRHAAM